MGHARKQQITIFPTNGCNLRCTYCAAHSSVHQNSTQKIDLKFARRGITDYFSDDTKHQIRYYSSGEPTQAMDIVQETWEFAHSIVGDRLVSEIQTNCCFSKETAEWLADHISFVWASIDGWPEIQNTYRPFEGGLPSFDLAMMNAQLIKERTFVGIRMTIVEETANKQIELIEYFNKQGFNYIASEPVFSPVKADSKAGNITQLNLRTYIKNFVEAWHVATKMGVTYLNSFMVNFDEKVEYACRACLPTPHLTTDGYVSACDLGFYGTTPLKDLIYGKYDKKTDTIIYNELAIRKLLSRKCSNMDVCIDCKIRDYCGGGCLGRAYHETRNFYGTIADYCWATRYLAKYLPIGQVKIPYLHP